MEIVVTGRNVEVPDHFRVHVTDKVGRLERYDHKLMGMHVELFHEPNRRQLKTCQRVEITGRGGCGSVARAEATAKDFYAALDQAIAKLEGRLRRSHDRRRLGARRVRAMAGRAAGPGDEFSDALSDVLTADDVMIPSPRLHEEHLDDPGGTDGHRVDGVNGNGLGRRLDERVDGHHDDHDDIAERDAETIAAQHGADHPDDPDPRPGRVVRRKVHTSNPMTVDDALARMELVGHDFYLFADVDSGEPSVVYRRRGYDYGLIRLGG